MAHKEGLKLCKYHQMYEGDVWEALGNEEYNQDPTAVYRNTRYYCMNCDCDYTYVDSYLIRYISSKPPPTNKPKVNLGNRIDKPKKGQKKKDTTKYQPTKQDNKANKALLKAKKKYGNM